jgi:enamine deaminase RidA (YjgF/YER057c/UK114 family)
MLAHDCITASKKSRRQKVEINMTSGAEARLQELGLILPALPATGGIYVPAKTVGRMVYLSGVISTGPNGVITGTAGAACALIHLAVLKKHLGSLDAVEGIVGVNG